MNHDREPLPTRVDDLPALPAEAWQAFDAGLRALGLDDLPDPVRGALADHLRLLLAWNQSINLTGIRSPAAALREHLLDSLAAVHVLRRQHVHALLDLGSGGGFPGLPLAVAVPVQRALLVESVAKKAAFLEAAGRLVSADTVLAAGWPAGDGPAIDVFAGRAEALAADPRHRQRWPAVVARAIAPLAELAELALPLVAVGGILVAWKRHPLEAELAAAEPAVARLGGHPATLVPVPVEGLEDHVLVIVEKVAQGPPGYPRDRARRHGRPIAPGDPLPSA